MIEVVPSKDFVYLCMVYNEYLKVRDKEGEYTFKPLSLTWNKKIELFELRVDIISNQQNNHNESETEGCNEFSREQS